jgi:ATP-binding cassette subfamily C protein CydC
LQEGRCLAIVGSSGAGKSTLVNLLLRFWDYSHGSIRLGGQELRRLTGEQVRRHLSVVSQRTYLFSGSVRDNLLLANPTADEEAIFEAAKRAKMHDFIQSLPQGYETWIGEHGLHLSGGERRRLDIARAFLQNAPIWVLDEPTAHLDALAEQAMMQELRSLLSGRTTLLITHRLVDLDWADEILVLDRGSVVERGSHQELIMQRGLYRHMFDIQRGERLVGKALADPPA